MKTHQREIMVYYNPESGSDRRCIAHAKGVVSHLKTYSFAQTPSTGTSWNQIIDALDVHPKELLNKADPYYQANLRGRDFDREGWINVLRYNPELIKAPIALRGNKAIVCNSPTDIYRLTT